MTCLLLRMAELRIQIFSRFNQFGPFSTENERKERGFFSLNKALLELRAAHDRLC